MSNPTPLSPTAPADFDWGRWDDEPHPAAWPMAQWVHGNPSVRALGLNHLAYTGGLFLPARQADGLTLPNWSPVEITFRRGASEAGLAGWPRLAVLRTRFRWVSRQAGRAVFVPRERYAENAGLKGNLQILAAAEGTPESPLAVTFNGRASQEMERVLRDFQTRVLAAANRTAPAGQELPRYAFFLPLRPGPHQKARAGFESVITPPALDLLENVDRETLIALYAGRPRLEVFQAWYRASAAWAAEWDHFSAGQSEPAESGASSDEIELQ